MTLIPHSPLPRSWIPSPAITQLPHLSSVERDALPYPPDFFPGARDVSTSFGPMRVYEWGNETGRKIMLIHGDATSAPLWRSVADELVERGCRVIVLVSLKQRVLHRSLGPWVFLDSSRPALPPITRSPAPLCRILFHSPLVLRYVQYHWLLARWGGDFVASFPNLVRSVALLAPVGLLRGLPKSYVDLRQAARGGEEEGALRERLKGVLGIVEDTIEQKTGTETHVAVDADAIAKWQFEHHEGHAASFISTLVHGPIQDQHEVWKMACGVLKAKRRERGGKERLVVICGSEDGVVPAKHLTEDPDGMMGSEEYVFESVEGGHGFLMDEEACWRVVKALVLEWEI